MRRRQAVIRGVLSVLFFLAIAVALTFLVLPVVAIFTHVPVSRLLHEFSNPIVTDALLVSLKTIVVSQIAILLLGTPTAYFLASRRFPGRPLVVTLVELPIVLPPAVAGIGLIVAFGRVGLLGSTFDALGINVSFNQAAVVLAISLVAGPFYVRQAIASFEAVDQNLIAASRTLGAGSLRARRSAWRAAWASSGRRSCSRAASRDARRRCRLRSTRRSRRRTVSMSRSRSAPCSSSSAWRS